MKYSFLLFYWVFIKQITIALLRHMAEKYQKVFQRRFHVPKTKVKWTYSFVKCSGTQEKEYEWNHGYVCGRAANDEIHTIVYFYENW